MVIPKGATFQDYLRLSLPEDEVAEIPLSLKAMQASSSKKTKERGVALTEEEKVLLITEQTIITSILIPLEDLLSFPQ